MNEKQNWCIKQIFIRIKFGIQENEEKICFSFIFLCNLYVFEWKLDWNENAKRGRQIRKKSIDEFLFMEYFLDGFDYRSGIQFYFNLKACWKILIFGCKNTDDLILSIVFLINFKFCASVLLKSELWIKAGGSHEKCWTLIFLKKQIQSGINWIISFIRKYLFQWWRVTSYELN